MADSVKRVTRLTAQMRFLARDAVVSQETFPLEPLIEEAFREAQKYQPVKSAQLKYEHEQEPILVAGDRAALKHALAEVMLNALQANPTDARIAVRLHADGHGNGNRGLQIEVQDNGTGFTPEAAQKATTPFFGTRNVGIGLGLTVSRKIVETHRGKLEIVVPKTGQAGIVRITLPLETSLSAKG
jgi:signal transduction histidine kinase